MLSLFVVLSVLDEFVIQLYSSIKGKYTGLVDLLLLTKHRT